MGLRLPGQMRHGVAAHRSGGRGVAVARKALCGIAGILRAARMLRGGRGRGHGVRPLLLRHGLHLVGQRLARVQLAGQHLGRPGLEACTCTAVNCPFCRRQHERDRHMREVMLAMRVLLSNSAAAHWLRGLIVRPHTCKSVRACLRPRWSLHAIPAAATASGPGWAAPLPGAPGRSGPIREARVRARWQHL